MNIVCSGFRALLRNEEPTLITRFFVWVGKNCGRYICMHVSHTHCYDQETSNVFSINFTKFLRHLHICLLKTWRFLLIYNISSKISKGTANDGSGN